MGGGADEMEETFKLNENPRRIMAPDIFLNYFKSRKKPFFKNFQGTVVNGKVSF